MKKVIIFSTICLLTLVFACKKVMEKNDKKTVEKIFSDYMTNGETTSEDPLDYGIVSYDQINNRFGQTNDVVVIAHVEETDGSLMNAGTLGFNQLVVSPTPENNYFARLENSDSLNVTQSFGEEVIFTLSGNTNVQPFASQPVRLPNTIYGTEIALPGSELHIATPLRLNWIPDNSSIDHKMYVQISYYKGLSQIDMPGAPNSVQSIFYVVPDNGTITISTADLSRFPVGTYAGISLARGYATTSTIFKRGRPTNFYSLAVVRASTVPLLVVQ